MRTERALQEYLKVNAKNNGISFFKLEAVGRRGFPDVMLLKGGVIAFIELKSPSGKGRLHALQEKTIQELLNQGANVYVADNKDTCDTIISTLTNKRPKRSH